MLINKIKQVKYLICKKMDYIKRYNSVKEQIISKYKSTEKNIIYMFICPQYRNLGDHAIVEAEKQFIKEKCRNYEMIDIYLEDTEIAINVIKKIIRRNDIIAFNGGGYVGDEYLHAEISTQNILRTFKDNKCILFPQTIYFSNTDIGKKELNKTIKSYCNHKNFYIVAREEKSFNIFTKYFNKENIILCPDIVFYFTPIKENEVRRDITLCLRNDVEKVLSDKEEKKIINFIKSKYDNVIITDTVCNYDVKREYRKDSIDKLLSQFYRSKLVITDRIHGMIFATITNTPCIVISNYNHKVKETYKWIKHLNYIKFVDDINDIELLIESFENNEIRNEFVPFDKNIFEKYYEKVADIINN